jgi:ribosomal protein L11 methyltransferase
MSTIWRLTAFAEFKPLADAVERLDEVYPPIALSWLLFDDGPAARMDVLFEARPDEATFREASGLAEDIAITIEPMPDEDWVRISLEGLKPVDAGRFVLFGAHDREAIKPGQIGIEIEAGPAFGTGHHGTTRGCLIAFDDMLTAGFDPKTVFDLGCGTAALAIAAAKILPDAEIIASDIDPEAIEESAENCTKNGTPEIDCFVAEGLDHARLAGREFELIFANILAGPLVDLAPGIAAALAPGGRVILSGLLTEQEPWVRDAYLAAGLDVHRQPPLEGWECLVASKRQSRA